MSTIDFISLLKEVKKFQSDPKVISAINKLLDKVTQDTSKATLEEIYNILNEAPTPDQLKLLSEEALKYAETRSGTLIQGIDETTSERFRELFASALEEGMSAQQFADSLNESGLFNEDRALLIARTETAFAHNEAALLSYQNSEGVVVGKEWLVANDACEICLSIDPSSIPLDAMFQSEDGDEYLSPPAHPNCRCTTTATLDIPFEAKSESVELQKAETYKPTEAMAEEARRALKWKAEGKAGGTRVGLARANQLVKRENLSESTVKRMFSFFSRHEVDKQGKGFSPDEEGYPSKGRVAWALWGGDAGFSWSRRIVESLKEKG
jgi:hypothetical protein